jgi:hypothetical protein
MVTEKEELLRHVLEKARRKCKISPPVYAQRLGCSLEILLSTSWDAHDSLSFLSSDFPADAGEALDNSGEFDAEGGEAGFSGSPDPNPASRLKGC